MSTNTNQSQFDWNVVFAGAVVAVAITLILSQFGSIIGLSSDGVLAGRVKLAHWAVIATGIWLIWTQLIASILGGYIAGRMRVVAAEDTVYESELKDGFYGLATWAISTLIIFTVIALGAAFGVLIENLNGSVDVSAVLSDKEKKTVIIYAFIIGASSLISSVASWWAATVGGDHRDKKIDFTKVISFK